MNNSELEKSRKLHKELEIDMKFNENFEPTSSRRNVTKSLFDAVGRIRETGQDVCDCLCNSCTGCHFPCSRCKSQKCGKSCRRCRNDYVERIKIEGAKENKTILNPNF